MTETLMLLLKLSVGVLILAIGMGATFADLGYLWRRPRLLLRSLLAMYVLVPLAAFLLVAFLPLSPGLKAALLVFAVSAGAPLLPRKLGAFGSGAYVFSLLVISSVLAIVMVPAWVGLLGRHFDVAAQIAPSTVAVALGKAFLLPLALGMALRAIFPRLGERLSERLIAGAGVVLGVCALLLLATHAELLTSIRWQGMATLITLLLLALAIGHALGGPSPDDRTALAIACATRHLGIALLVAASFPGPRTTVVVAAYVLASAAVTLPYLKWRRKASAAASARQAASSGP